MPSALLDTGPLVAFVNRHDRYHDWAKRAWNQIESPLLTCEAVIIEACFLLRTIHLGHETVLSMVTDEIIQIPFQMTEEVARIKELMTRYQSVPMSLADACLVRMAEKYPNCPVLTLDSDFAIYRKHRNRSIAVITPFA